MNCAEATEIVDAAVDRILAEQAELLDFDVSERALSHHVALNVAALIPQDLKS